jgi:hypothetical protein
MVQIRVAGTVGPVIAEHLPGFLAIQDPPVTVITGRLDPGEDLATIMALLIRRGVRPLDGRVTG